MGLTNSQYQTIMREYEQKQLKSHDILTQHYEDVYKKLPEFKSLDESISIMSVQYGRRLLDGDEGALDSLKEELSILRSSKQQLLTSAGFPADYLEPVYECPDCKDTGYIGNAKCRCFKRAITKLLYEQSNLKGILESENFDTFCLDYYSDRQVDPKTGKTSRAIMEHAYQTCKNFVQNFEHTSDNIFLYGDVGVGKTFLSNCIARDLIDAGYSVLYYSAPNLFNILAQGTFDHNDYESKQMQQYVYDCDLLIVDDLGTELANAFTASQFFTCINERLLNMKSTVVSTNLSLDSLADLYTERSFSRITSNYILLKLFGDDIRIIKKIRANREGK